MVVKRFRILTLGEYEITAPISWSDEKGALVHKKITHLVKDKMRELVDEIYKIDPELQIKSPK